MRYSVPLEILCFCLNAYVDTPFSFIVSKNGVYFIIVSRLPIESLAAYLYNGDGLYISDNRGMIDSDMTIKIDNTGKIVIPAAFIAALNLKEHDSVKISIDSFKQRIVINREIPACVFCDVAVDLIQISGRYVRSDCRDKLASAAIGDRLH